MDKRKAEWIYTTMVKIRRFEERVEKLLEAGDMPGFAHFYIGQEAIAAGMCADLYDSDYITSTHRGHGHCIAKGGRLDRMMAELYGKSTGYNKGKGGSMHIASPEIGILGANGIVGGGIPLAVGAGLSSKFKKDGRVTICFFGDGATNQGSFHEGLNLASVLSVPVIFVCENNQFGVGTRICNVTRQPDLAKRSIAYCMPGVIVDGQDVFAVYEAAQRFISRARQGGGPALLEMKTWRFRAHFSGEPPLLYRTREEEEQWLKKDPLVLGREQMQSQSLLTQKQIDEIEADVAKQLEAAVEFARNSAPPAPESAVEEVYA
ncbi:MAG: thiamine pyrophosphate-dependent dehydrogenase E1 component subunit alpha [Terriglobia bacterium]|jgi:pyruvate dehydrogenase E1 component alpha subunit